jgi:glycosyltransferase involved in cell wall biosynthesis
VVAVSERDGRKFKDDYALPDAFVIPTGVDLEHFGYVEPSRNKDIVFCGSMDWLANQEAVRFFMDEIWPRIVADVPDARMTVVGRAPPESLVNAAQRYGGAWTFTGFVDDVRAHISGAAVSVIPMRIAGGTRLKVYESMAMGPVVVSTAIGVEGLPVTPGIHCEIVDDAAGFAAAVVGLLRDGGRRTTMSRTAREHVQRNFGYEVAARAFERACGLAIERRAGKVRTLKEI